MGLEAVKEDILNSARHSANSLIGEARKEAAQLLKEAEKKVEDMKKKSEEEAKKFIDIIKRQEIASAELEKKKTVLEAKKEAIESVFMEAKKQLWELDDKKRELYTKKILERVKKDLEPAYAYCNKRDAKFLKGFETNVMAIDIVDIIGGLKAENKEKTIIVDYSFEAMLERIKDTELQNISKLLF